MIAANRGPLHIMRPAPHRELHRSGASNWLRAAVLGSNDAIVSTAGLLMGVAATEASRAIVVTTGIAGLVAGALSMAVGEFVSVSSQRDAEEADIAKERAELATAPDHELEELTGIYVKRGLDESLARQVAIKLTDHDVLASHLRDELGIEAHARVRPLQAAWVSAASFALFALVPVLGVAVAPGAWRIAALALVTLISLAGLGAAGARIAGASPGRVVARVTAGGALALAVTFGIGRLVGVSVG